MKKKLFISICARGGSKGVPNKNIKKLDGKPLIAYSIILSNKLKQYFDVKLGLSTDDLKIKEVAQDFGLVTDYIRPNLLASDSAGKLDVIKALYAHHQLDDYVADFVLDLDVSSPLRNLNDILNAFHIFEKEPETLNVFSVSKAHKNPYFNMVEQDENGYVHLCKPLNQSVYSRQSAPEVFEMNASFYIFRNEYFKLNKDSVFTKKTRPFVMDHICFDIDETLDFEFMEFLVKNQKLDFEI